MEDKKESFWETLQKVVSNHEIEIDRPQNSAHPKYPDYIYPFDYGFLVGTTSADGGGIDVWKGSENNKDISGVIVIIDPIKNDSEIKILLGCTEKDMKIILETQKRGAMNAVLIKNLK